MVVVGLKACRSCEWSCIVKYRSGVCVRGYYASFLRQVYIHYVFLYSCIL